MTENNRSIGQHNFPSDFDTAPAVVSTFTSYICFASRWLQPFGIEETKGLIIPLFFLVTINLLFNNWAKDQVRHIRSQPRIRVRYSPFYVFDQQRRSSCTFKWYESLGCDCGIAFVFRSRRSHEVESCCWHSNQPVWRPGGSLSHNPL